MVAVEEFRDSAAEPTRYRSLVDGKHVEAVSGERIDVVAPSDGQVFATMPRGKAADIDRAMVAARRAFEEGSWATMAPADRGRILMKLSGLIAANHEALSQLEARDVGKSIKQARADVTVLSRYYEFYAGAADKAGGETIPLPGGFTAMTFREPHGVVGAILPWNSPTQMLGRTSAPALAMGNVLVVKPAEDACLSTIRIAELALEAGLPPGVLNIVTGLGEEAGAALAAHKDVNFITFTGSPEVGAIIQKIAADNHVAVTLELGGKSPQIVFGDADLDAALPIIVGAITVNSGQTCTAGSRLLVEESAWDRVAGAFAERFGRLVTGPHSEDYDYGALINGKQRDRVKKMIAEAKASGVGVLAEGKVAGDAADSGYYVPAVLLGPVPRDHTVAQQEVFGPCLSVIPFKDEADAIRLANDTEYGLAAGVWTSNISRAMRMAKKVRSGQVYINGYGAGGGVELPFGGFKSSGHGREKGLEALKEFSATKTVIINHG